MSMQSCDVSQEYKDQDEILFTYVARAMVTDKEVYNTPYSRTPDMVRNPLRVKGGLWPRTTGRGR